MSGEPVMLCCARFGVMKRLAVINLKLGSPAGVPQIAPDSEALAAIEERRETFPG